MKVRNGFVSNSSSSSFIVAFAKVPESVEELKTLLFGDATTFEGYPTEKVAETVWQDMHDEGENAKLKTTYTLAEVIDLVDGWDFYERIEDLKGARDLIKDGVTLYRFSYADDCGSYFSALEHGGLFDNLPHVRISHH